MKDETTISGLLQKRADLEREKAECHVRMATIVNDLDAIDRVLEAFSYPGDIEGKTARVARIILFYRNELREFVQGELAKAARPLSLRELSQLVCQTDGKDGRDRHLLADISKRVANALRQMRRRGIVASEKNARGLLVWKSTIEK
jgi:hypothetical protein